MSGAVITMRMLDGGTREALRQLILLGTRPETLLKPIGIGMVRNVHDRFENAKAPGGEPWAPLRPDYAAAKRGAGILRGAAMRGGLMGSITRDVQGAELAVGTAKIYGAIHQFGGVIQPRRASRLAFRIGGRLVLARQVTIPARPYLGWDAADEEVVEEVTEAMFARALNTASRRAAGQITDIG